MRRSLAYSSLAAAGMVLLCLHPEGKAMADMPDTATAVYEDDPSIFPNPERGLHYTFQPPWSPEAQDPSRITAWEESEAAYTLPLDGDRLKHDRLKEGRSVVGVRYNLARFRRSGLADSFLVRLDADFVTARRAGVKLIVRFVYGWYGVRPDAPKAIILRHLDQLQPVLERNQDVLCHLDAGFVGAWGEWHDSTNGLLVGSYRSEIGADAREILDRIFATVPRSRMITLRYPTQKSSYFHPDYVPGGRDIWEDSVPMPRPEEAFKGTNESRAGNLNDGLHSNSFDSCYGWEGALDVLARIKQRVSTENRYVVQSGEMDAGFDKTMEMASGERMLAEGRRMRWSLLTVDTPPGEQPINPILARWQHEGRLEEIERSLGYRLRLLESRLPERGLAGGRLWGSLALRNDGFAAPYNPRCVELILRHTQTEAVHIIPLPDDPRRWLPDNDRHAVALDVRLPNSLTPGRYQVLLNFPDPCPSLHDRPEYSIRLANRGVWEPPTGYNSLLRTLEIAGR